MEIVQKYWEFGTLFSGKKGGEQMTHTIDWERLGERVHVARRRKRLTSTELAQLAGTTRTTISRLENGHKPWISLDVITRIAKACDVSLDYLVGLDEGADAELAAAVLA